MSTLHEGDRVSNYLLQARLVSGGNGSPLVYQGDIYDTSALPVR